MNWEALGAIAETLGAIGVIATLIYLAIQVRHSKSATEANTKQMRGQAFVSLESGSARRMEWIMDNPKQTEVIVRASNSSFADLSLEDQRLLTLYSTSEAQYYEMAFMLWQEDALDEISYTSREEYYLSILMAPGRREWWESYSSLIDPRFRKRIDDQLSLVKGKPTEAQRLPMFAPTSTTGEASTKDD